MLPQQPCSPLRASAPSSSSRTPSFDDGIDVAEEKEHLQLLSLMTGNNDKLLKLLLLCRQYGDAATHAALEAASAVASEEANLTEIAKEMEKKKREEQLQASDKASKAEEERKLLLVEAKKAKKESESLASQAAKKWRQPMLLQQLEMMQ